MQTYFLFFPQKKEADLSEFALTLNLQELKQNKLSSVFLQFLHTKDWLLSCFEQYCNFLLRKVNMKCTLLGQ